MIKRITLATALLSAGTAAFSQDLLGATGVSVGSNFFVALVCGVIIAFAMQYLLTALSVAIGISAAPNLKEKYAESKAHDPRMDDDSSKNWNEFDHGADETPTGVKISAGVGLWNTLTTAVALFTGTAFAMTLVPFFAETAGTAATLALAIWGTFFMLLFWLESRFASTLVGGIISTATSGLKSVAQGVGNLVTPSPASQVESVANSTIDKLQASLGGSFDTDRIVGAIEQFGNKIDQNTDKLASNVNLPSYDKLRSDFREIMSESSKDSGSNPAKWTAIQSVIQSAVDSGDKSGSDKGKKKSAELKRLMAELKSEYEQQGDTKQAAKKVAARKGGVDDKKVDEYVAKIEEALSTSKEDEMEAESLLQKIEAIVQQDGGMSVDGLTEKLGEMDREDVSSILANNTSLSKDKAASYVDTAFGAISTVREKLATQQGADTSLMTKLSDADLEHYTEMARNLVAGYIESADEVAQEKTGMDLSGLKREIVKAMNNPEDTLSLLQGRLKSFDVNTVLGLLPDNGEALKSKRSDIEQALLQAKDEVQTKANELQTQAQGAMRQAERRAVIEAEHARKTAASAAWWLVLSIVVSGVAALAGALFA